MNKTFQIFVPEWVPLENKGEEAIIRGMSDVLFPEGNAEFHILDMNARQYRFVDGLHVYPGVWFYSQWRSQEFRLGLTRREIYASTCSLLRNGLNVLVPSWVKIPQGPVRSLARHWPRIRNAQQGRLNEKEKALKRILAADYLIAGHDGAFNEYDCHVIDLMRAQGMRYGIFGTAMKVQVKSPAILSVLGRTLSQSDFIYCRDPVVTAWARHRFPGLNIELVPDPAFGMRPSADSRVDEIIEREALKEFLNKPVVMVATAEPAPIARHSFGSIPIRRAKLSRHHDLLAALVRHIIGSHDVNVLFLPHTTGPTPDLDDRKVAAEVLRRLNPDKARVRLLATEYSARDLKGLIKRAALLVGERIHSIIGAVGVHTPFLCLGVKQDLRVSSIVGDMCESKDAIYFLNNPAEKGLIEHFETIWDERPQHRERLRKVSAGFDKRLKEVGGVIRKRIGAE